MSSFCIQHLCKVGKSTWPLERLPLAQEPLQSFIKMAQSQPIMDTLGSSNPEWGQICLLNDII